MMLGVWQAGQGKWFRALAGASDVRVLSGHLGQVLWGSGWPAGKSSVVALSGRLWQALYGSGWPAGWSYVKALATWVGKWF